MAWCYYKDLRHKVGARLRVRRLPARILAYVPHGMAAQTVEVDSRAGGRATLMLWCTTSSFPAPRPHDGSDAVIERCAYVVVVVSAPEDPNWIVER